MWKMGGHSPGSSAIVVSTKMGRVSLAADLIYDYKNLEYDWPVGAYWRLDQVISGQQRLKRKTEIIIPGHDWGVWERYPNGMIG